MLRRTKVLAVLGGTVSLAAVAAGADVLAGGETSPYSWQEEQSLVARDFAANEAVIAECMNDHGFLYRPAPDLTTTLSVDPFSVDTAAARKYGMGLTVIDANEEILSGLPENTSSLWSATLLGGGREFIKVQLDDGREIRSNTDGCVYEARRTIYGNVAEYTRLKYEAQILEQEMDEYALSSSNVTGALTSWRECMALAGFDQESPSRAVLDFPVSDNPVIEEIDLAVQITTCTSQTDLRATLEESRLEARERLAQTDRELLDSYDDLQIRAVGD